MMGQTQRVEKMGQARQAGQTERASRFGLRIEQKGSLRFEALPSDCYCVFIRNLTCFVHIGIHDYERDAPQRLVINMRLLARDRTHKVDGNIKNVVCYETIKDMFLRHIATRQHWELIEELGFQLIESVMQDKRVEQIALTLEKPDVFDNCEGVGIELYRQR